MIQPRDAKAVYIKVPGTLKTIDVRPGDFVRKGQILATLEDINIDLQITKKQGELKSYNIELETLNRLKHDDKAAWERIPAVESVRNTVKKQLDQLLRDKERLVVKAPVDGTILPAPASSGEASPGVLAQWSGTLLDKENIGATVTPNQRGLFCYIGDPDKLEAHLVIDQEDIGFVKQGQSVEILMDQDASRNLVYSGAIFDIAPEELKAVSPKQLASTAGGPVATKVDESGIPRPLNPSYQATVLIDGKKLASSGNHIAPGLLGMAKIETEPRTLANRLWRYVTATFSFKL